MVLRVYRITIGSIALVLVDIIWVTSSELTEYLYHDKRYAKPFFSTYVKTSMFMVYLIGFIFYKSWRLQCLNLFHRDTVSPDVCPANGTPMYSVLEQDDNDNEELRPGTSINNDNLEYERVLSDPIWIPVKFNDVTNSMSEKSSGTESDGEIKYKRNKSVRFSKLTEVRQLSDTNADAALFARLSYNVSLKLHEVSSRSSISLPLMETVKLSFIFALFWFAGNLSYQISLMYSEAGLVNVLSSTSPLFTFVLTRLFPSNSSTDRFSITKLIAVFISIGSVVIITESESHDSSNIPIGALWALSGAFFYAAYIVMLRHKVEDEDSLDMQMFFGFVGLFNFLFLWPSFIILNYSQLEVFQWPNVEQWCIILVNGLIGTVFSELIWLWGCFLTSSLIAALSTSLTIPLTIMFDVFLKDVHYPRLFILGTIPLFISFFVVTLLSHYEHWDPIATLFQTLVRRGVLRRPMIRMRDSIDNEQTQSLINENA